MNYEDEPYVRFYTRDTLTWNLLGWEGQSVLALMLHGRFDRSGVFDCLGHEPSQAVTAVTRIPEDVTARGLKALFDTKTWVLSDGRIVWPEYVRAQNCRRSDRLRQQESRENRSKQALVPRDACHDSSQPVTDCHSQLSSAQQSPAQLSLGGPGDPSPSVAPPSAPPPQAGNGQEPLALSPTGPKSTGRKREPKATQVPKPLAEDWSPSEGQLKALATRFSVDAGRLLVIVPEFRWYWREGDGVGTRSTLRGWAQTFSNRCAQLAKSGELYREHVPRLGGGRHPQRAASYQAAVPGGYDVFKLQSKQKSEEKPT